MKRILTIRRVMAGFVALAAVFAGQTVYAASDQDWGNGNSKGRIQEIEATIDGLSNRIAVQQQLIESLQSDIEEVTGIFTEPTLVFLEAVTAEEGRFLRVAVALSKPSVYQVTVDYSTVDGTAIAGQHYESSFGTLVFEPGNTVQELTVNTIDNYHAKSPSVSFRIHLSNPQYVHMGASTIDASIVDTEDKPFLVIKFSRVAYEPPLEPDHFTASYQFYDGFKFSGYCRLDYSHVLYTPPEPIRISLGVDQDRSGFWPPAELGVDFDFPEFIELPAGVPQGEIQFGQVYEDDFVEGYEYVLLDPSRTTIMGDAVFNPYCTERARIVDTD